MRRGRAGDDRAALLACFAATHLGVVYLSSPVTDTDHAYHHWPAAGYLPLIALVPAVLRTWPRWLATVAVALPATLLAFVFVDIPTGVVRVGAFHDPFAGWSELGRAVERQRPDGRPLVVADNYVPGAQIDFELGGRADVFVLDHPRNVQHGRALQYEVWKRDEDALRARGGERALVVVDIEDRRIKDPEAWLVHVASRFDRFEPVVTVDVPGVRRLLLFDADVRVSSP